MINILPQEGRAIAKKDYLLRLVIIGLLAGAVIAVICCALLFPSYMIANGAREDAIAETKRLEGTKQGDVESTSAVLALAKEEMGLFSPLASSTPPSGVIEKLLAQRAGGISLSQVQYDLASGKIVLSGIASTREKLLAFFEALKTTPGVVKADLPVNNLAKSVDAPFSIAVSYEIR